jgi:hypothetical protein
MTIRLGHLGRLTVAAAVLAAAAAGTLAPAHAGGASDAAAAAKYRVTLKVSEKEAVEDETKLALTGKVRPNPNGGKVTLQLQYDGEDRWLNLRTAKVKKNGSYKFTDKPRSREDRSYRVVKAGDGKARKGVSKERAVEVSGWDWLIYETPSATTNVLEAFEMPINGVDYRNTLYGDPAQAAAFTEFTLGRKCSVFEATFGLSDRTETGGQASILVRNDGVNVYHRVFDLGQSDPKTIDVSGVYRLRMDFAQVVTTPDTEPSAGAARVLCD